jgi:hypothetical protein
MWVDACMATSPRPSEDKNETRHPSPHFQQVPVSLIVGHVDYKITHIDHLVFFCFF